MNINLNELKPMQAVLDEKIAQVHNVECANTRSQRILAFLVELGELANETRTFKYWSLKGPSAKDVILEEYVDGIHFLVSLANDLDLDLNFEVINDAKSLTQQFIEVFELGGLLEQDFQATNLTKLFKQFLKVGLTLEFDQATIISGYLEKNKKNHQRQEEGY